MRNATLKYLGVKPYYWLFPLFWLGAVALTIYGIQTEPENRAFFIVFGSVFALVALLIVLWPILRLREYHGVKFTLLRSRQNSYEGILIPASKAKIRIAFIGGVICLLVGVFGLIFATDSEHKAHSGIITFVGLVLGVQWFKTGWGLQKGLLLAKEGIVWHQPMLSPICIPWQEIAVANACHIREQYGTASAFGILVSNPEKITGDKTALRKLQENYHRLGWHFYYYAEGLLLSTLTIQSAITFYLVYPEKRNELANGAAVTRIEQFDREVEN